MSLKSDGGTQQAQDPLVALEAEINKLKGKIKKLEKQIEAFEDDKTPKDEFSNQRYLKWQDQLSSINNLLAQFIRERLEAQASSVTTATAQQGK